MGSKFYVTNMFEALNTQIELLCAQSVCDENLYNEQILCGQCVGNQKPIQAKHGK